MKKYQFAPDGMKSGKAKKGLAAWLAAILALLALGGCRLEFGDTYDDAPVVYETRIMSNLDADGDIGFSPPATYIVSSAATTGSVLAGIDPVYGDEFRGFLDFELRGYQGVPYNAPVASAYLEVYIASVDEGFAGAGVPLLLDLVSFQPPNLIAGDFDRSNLPPLLSLPVTVESYDAGAVIIIDVTTLMIEAQRLDLPDFQLRFLLDPFAATGLVEIEDSVAETAPVLSVDYY